MKWKHVLLTVVVAFGAIQFVPYGHEHANPPVTGEPRWSSPQVADLARRACYDCHSNETKWPWYAHVAPVSWLVQRDVVEGREHLNFSAERTRKDGEDAIEELTKGDMPPAMYVALPPEAKLDPAELRALADGFVATLGGEGASGAFDADAEGWDDEERGGN
jgi:hypothetical protein